ncbi:MAG: hypothetical protein HY060_24540 [Proteobacteria bacterium]|nr:hypothetical protein [Pseudomonadota bacterium]
MTAALLAAWLAACQPMPHPFETEDKGNNPLLALREGVGVAVMPVSGLPSAFGERLSEALAGALRDAEIPAAVQVGNRGSFVVTGRAQADRREQQLEIAWEVDTAAGARIGTIALRQHFPIATFDADGPGPTPGQLAALAKRSAAQLVPLVRSDMPEAVAPTAIALGRIDGAPGDGAASLKRALEFVLRQSDIPVAGADRANALTLTGSVEMGRPTGGRQTVAIRWVLLLPDGSQIGDVRQENAVPAGILDQTWGNTALLVAEAAYDGIIALYEKVPDLRAH